MTKSIKHCIDALIPHEHQWKLDIIRSWHTILGNMKCTVTLEQITQDRIVLGVKHPAWAQELMMFAPMIKDRVNKLFDHERIKKIHFRVISQPRAKNNRSFFSQQPQTSYNPTLSTRELQSIEAIKDKELALSCKEFLIRCKKVKGSSS